MSFRLAVSGSTILSDSARLPELFAWGCDAIEIGSFADDQAYEYVLQECRRRQMQLGIHSPFYRDGDRYGLLLGESLAYAELERDLLVAKRDGLAYVLVHFPYLLTKNATRDDQEDPSNREENRGTRPGPWYPCADRTETRF